MRKRLITATSDSIRPQGEGWLDLERTAVVEITSEDKDFPIESAFGSGEGPGWRASAPGSQTIRLVFDQPQRLRCIALVFEENEIARTQEFVLRWSSDGGSRVKEIVRQQWNFSPLSRYARWKNIEQNFRALPYLNWSSIQTSVAEPLVPRLGTCVSLDAMHHRFFFLADLSRERPEIMEHDR
jgi:hypothetical protein